MGKDLNQFVIAPVNELLGTQATQIKPTVEHNQNLFERSLQLETQRQQANIDQLKAKSRPQTDYDFGVNRTRSADQNTENQIPFWGWRSHSIFLITKIWGSNCRSSKH